MSPWESPPIIEQLSREQVTAPVLIAPPGGFPVTERSEITDARITYHATVNSSLMDWLRRHQTVVIAVAAGLLVLAVLKKR